MDLVGLRERRAGGIGLLVPSFSVCGAEGEERQGQGSFSDEAGDQVVGFQAFGELRR